MPHTLPGNRTLGALYCELADPKTVERRVYLSCPAHDVHLFCSLGNLLPPGSPQRRTSNSLMRLQGQTSKLKRSGRLPSRNLPWQTPQNLSVRFGRRFSLGNARPMEIVATPVKLRALSCEDSFVSGEPSRPQLGGSLQPPDRQFRYYKLLRNRASSPTASYRSTNVIPGRPIAPGQKTLVAPCARNATSSSGVSCPCAGHWPPSKLRAMVISTAPSTDFPSRFAASLAVASCWVSAVLRAGRIFSSSRYITGTL